MKEQIFTFLKGVGMGAANTIPGVSGGTIAFITGIYERLILAIKSIAGPALKPLFKGDFREFAKQSDLLFLIVLGFGMVFSIFTAAQLIEIFLASNERLVWAFFFGLIVASIPFVAKKVGRWSTGPTIASLIGCGIAVGVALLSPGSENSNFLYLMLCGVVAMASMIVPGLSGSFVLLLMGNYELIMIRSVNQLREMNMDALQTLIPVGIGAVVGLLTLSHFLAWVFKKHNDVAVALMTGFVAGSLLSVWPWKEKVTEFFGEKEKTVGFDYSWPDLSGENLIAIGVAVAGFLIVFLIEKVGSAAK